MSPGLALHQTVFIIWLMSAASGYQNQYATQENVPHINQFLKVILLIIKLVQINCNIGTVFDERRRDFTPAGEALPEHIT